jgi:signal transduction histidine kinase/ActR/RegA family two-component response regulator
MYENARILIIDDDESTRSILTLIFGEKGYETETADTAQNALDKAAQKRFNLALLDLHLPDQPGLDLIVPLKKLHPDLGVVVVTGYASLETAVQALDSGASAYITKPLNMDEVLAKVKDVLSKQQLVDEKRQAEEALRRRNRELALLNRIIAEVTSTLDVTHVLNIACEGLADAFDVPLVLALLLNAETSEGTVVAEYRTSERSCQLGDNIVVADNPAAQHLLEHNAPLAISDVQADERLANAHHRLGESDPHALLLVPIPVVRGRVAGAISIQSPERRTFQKAEITLAQNVAAAAGYALETARLYQALWQNVEKLEETVAQRTAELQVALERARDADRVKSEFVSNVSHELRTPLASLKLFLGLLTRGRPEKHEEYLEILRRETDRLQDLIEALLDISRLDLGKMKVNLEPTDLNLLVGTLANDRGALAADGGLILDVELTEGLPLVEADPKLVEQVLTNLLSNAINYTADGGTITLCTAEKTANGQEWVTALVSDTGPGIPEEERPHLFERFYRGSAGRTSDAPGTGLGLAICKEIMALHGGRVTLESPPVELRTSNERPGSTFVIWLPLTR